MKIHKSFAPFICAFFISPLFTNASGIRFVNFDEALHSEYKSNENESGSYNNLVINELVNPYANSNPIPTTQLNQLNHIATSVGNENPVKVCEDEFLIIYSTFTSSNVEYVFKRIRGGNETIVQGRSSNYKLDLDPLNPAFTDYQDGDIYFIEIFDYSTTPTQNLISSQITIEVLTLPTGLSSFDGGTIEQQDQIICSEGIPETLTTSETVNLNFTYQWEYSLDNGNTFNEIQGANNFSLIFSSVVTQTTTYRRSTRWTGGGSCIKYTNEHLVTVIDVEPGKIVVGSNIPTICYGETPPLLENISLGATNAGNLSYEWQTSPDGINWTDTGSTSINYQQSQTLTKTSYFRRKAIQSGGGNTCVIFTDTVTITVASEIPVGTLSGNQTICEGNLPINPIVYNLQLDPQFDYQWQLSTDGQTYTDINGQNQKELTFSQGDAHLPSEVTYYKLKITQNINGVSCFAETESITIIELPLETTLTTNAPNNTICEGGNVTITAQGSNTHQFIVNGLTRFDASNNQLALEGLSQTTTVTVIAENDGCEKTHSIVINVVSNDPGEITNYITDCNNTGLLKFKSVSEGRYNGILLSNSATGTYSWETSTDGVNWSEVVGHDQEDFELNNPTFPLFVRRITIVDPTLANDCTKPSNVIELQGAPKLLAGKVSPSELLSCTGASIFVEVINGTEGNNVNYLWEISTDNGVIFSSIASQTDATLLYSEITQTTQFRRRVSWKGDNSCPEISDVFTLTVLENDPGSIETGIVSICYNSSPPQINSISPTNINNGNFSYQWEFSTDEKNWKEVNGQTSENFYTTNTLTQTHYYRRKSIQNASGNICENHTDSFTVVVYDEIPTDVLSGTQYICGSEKPSTAITYESPLNTLFNYQWMSSTDGVNFYPIQGEQGSVLPIHTNVSYTPTQTTHYRMDISNKGSAVNCILQTSTATVFFNDEFELAYNGSSNVICGEDSLTFTALGSGLFSFYLNGILAQGPSSTTTFTITNPKSDVEITLINDRQGSCSNQKSLTLTYKDINAGKISGPEVVCSGNTNNFLLESQQEGNVNGLPLSENSFSYQWQSSLDGIFFADILNANASEYTVTLLTTETHFRRIFRYTEDEADCEGISNIIKIEVLNTTTQPSSIQVSTSLCSEGVYASYSGGIPSYKGELFDNDQNLIGSGSTNDHQSFENLLPGRFYSLHITDNSCYQPKEIVFEVPLEINFDPQKVAIEHDLCRDQPNDIGRGSIRLAADAFTGGSNAFDYAWSGPDNFTGQGAEINGLLPGTYLVTVTDKLLGCTQTERIILLGKDPLTLSLKASNLSLGSDGIYQLSCQENSDASIEVNVSGGHGQFSYSWKKDGTLLTGNQSKLVASVSVGYYEVVVTDIPPIGIYVDHPCQEVMRFRVQSAIPLSVQVDRTALETTSCENISLEVPVTIAGGAPPYTISIEGHGSITTNENSYTFSSVDPKNVGSNLIVSVVDQGDCSITAESIPIESTGQFSFVSSSTNIDCLKGTLGAIQLSLSQTLTGTQTLHLEWKGDTVHYFDTWENGNGLLEDLNNPGTYTVTVTNSKGCLVHSESFNIQDISKGKLAVTIDREEGISSCDSANGAIKLEVSGEYPPYLITWQQRSQTSSWTTLSNFENNALISGLSSGTYRAIVSDASTALNNDSCSEKITTREITIQHQVLKIIQFSASNAADLCDSEGSGQIRFQIQNTLTSSGTTEYSYQIDGANVSSGQIINQTNLIKINGISPGDHQLKVQVKSGNSSSCFITEDFSIENTSTPITFSGELNYESSLCNEPTRIVLINENISGGVPFQTGSPYALEWRYRPYEDNTTGTVSHSLYGWEINNAHTGTYQLIISDANRCQNDPSIPIIFNVQPPQGETISVNGILKSNTGESVKAIHLQCGDENKGTIGIAIEGGVRPFEVRWFLYASKNITNDSSANDLIHLPEYDNQTSLNELAIGVYKLEIRTTTSMCSSRTSDYTYYTEDIEIKPNPNLHIISGPFIENNLCEGKPGRITVEVFDNNQEGLIFYYDGKVIQEEEYEQVNNQTFTLIIENPVEEGEFKILNAQGCSISQLIKLELGEPEFSYTSASLESSNNILAKEEITFSNDSSNPYVRSEWIFGDFSEPVIQSHTATSSTIKYSYLSSGAYPVTLRIYNTNGCVQEITHVVVVGKGYNITLPNVFSPNNDGMNDYYRPLVSGFKEVEFSIFDPSGNQLYLESMEEPNPNHIEGFDLKGWDASNATQALYFIYSFRGVLFDETVVEKSGTFILIQ